MEKASFVQTVTLVSSIACGQLQMFILDEFKSLMQSLSLFIDVTFMVYGLSGECILCKPP